jgi:hypothetical protein
MVSSDTTPYIYAPLALINNFSKPSRVVCSPVVHISGIQVLVICEYSFISKKKVLKKAFISLQLLLCSFTKLCTVLKIVPMQCLV